jgi:hypothetical protein
MMIDTGELSLDTDDGVVVVAIEHLRFATKCAPRGMSGI